jgi:hypothetical protein
MSCETQTFTGITQNRFDCLVQAAQSTGITITGNVGEASKGGVTVRWQFDPASQVLELQCTEAPFFLPCATITSKLQDLVNGCP